MQALCNYYHYHVQHTYYNYLKNCHKNSPRILINIMYTTNRILKVDRRSAESKFASIGELETPEGIRNDQKVIDHSNLPRRPPSTCFGHVKART